ERVRARAWEKVGHLYPHAPGGGTVTAWLWCRTVQCPNPACRASAPLVSSFWLSKRSGANTWIEPRPNAKRDGVLFRAVSGKGNPPSATKVTTNKWNFRCAICGAPIDEGYVKEWGSSYGLGLAPMAAAVDVGGRRTYLDPDAAPGGFLKGDPPPYAPDLE